MPDRLMIRLGFMLNASSRISYTNWVAFGEL